jgi:hypothetical protein
MSVPALTTTILSMIKELVCIKRGDVRQSQLDVLTTLINGASKDKNILLNQIVSELVTLTNVGPKYVRYNCLEFLIVVVNGLGSVLE